MDGTGEFYVKQNKPNPKNQRQLVFSHMWKLDPQVKCILEIDMIIYICDIYISSDIENKIVLVSLSEGATGYGRKKSQRMKNIETIRLCMTIIITAQ
jgi:hypothetical protein